MTTGQKLLAHNPLDTPGEEQTRNLVRFARQAGQGLRGLDADLWRTRLQHRYRELQAAFGRLLNHGKAADALAVASTLAEFLAITGRVAAGRTWLDHVLEADTLDDHQRAAALYQDGLLAFWQGADEEACSLHGHSLHLARRAGDQTLIALALCGLARVALHEDLDWTRTLCEEALATVSGTDNPTARANALHVLSVAAQMQGDLWQARRPMAQPIQLARVLGDSATNSAELSNLSVLERLPGAQRGRRHVVANGAAW